MKEYTFNNIDYVLEKDLDNVFNYEDIKNKVTDYFNEYDFILGDFSYNKVRLKGFFDENNKNVKKINNIKNLDDYLKNYCSFGCKWFLLRKNAKN